ncbi:hypothetical protein [Marinitoga aeolica]|uniref:DUF5668 domain-containing protein n=1 Tax=Marinitoga aeolica TaxID=2809031 RepID=A0ABY8PR68_9BACT|nr:hypothetical protein [Marinitoga aeolica]WGS65134.1 hypothetical protein JRV97_00845 [Marinitoga aeolica]
MRYIVGLFFIILGILFVVQGFNIDLILRIGINFTKFWPFILIIIGISILSKELKWLKGLNIFLVAIFLLLLVFWNFNKNIINLNFNNYKNYEKMEFEILPDSDALDLYFDLSALNLEINTDNVSDKISGYYYGPMLLNIDKKGNDIFFKKQKIIGKGYKIYINIPEKYLYNIYIDSGVANVELNNVSNIIKMLSINAGVSNLKGIINEFKESLYLDINSGVSKINLIIPKNTTYNLNYDGGIKTIKISDDLIKNMDAVFKGNIDAGVLNINIDSGE